jgi:hypothetical protein
LEANQGMSYMQTLQQPRRCDFLRSTAIIIFIFLAAAASLAQTAPAAQQVESPWPPDPNKYPGLTQELGRLAEEIQNKLQFPPMRGQSRLLPMMPDGTMAYAAIPNYGNVTHQALEIFQQKLQEDPVLRDWWLHGPITASGPKWEDSLETLSQLSQYLGDEIVVAGGMDGTQPSLLAVAEIRKPGLNRFLQQSLKGGLLSAVHIIDPQELATAPDRNGARELLVLVRPDFVVVAPDLATLRSFNARIDEHSHSFSSTAFGQRIAQAYGNGLALVVAADLHSLLGMIPPSRNLNTFQSTGFGDMKYLVWEHRSAAGQANSTTELSFTGPRHGLASWLAAPTHLGSLDFVSPKAIQVDSIVLANPARALDDVMEIASASNPNAAAMFAQSGQMLGLDLKEDLLRYLGGEITVELDEFTSPQPAWKAILRVTDANLLQPTLNKLMAAARMPVEESVEESITYYTVQNLSPKTKFGFSYAFVDGYLVVASSREMVTDAIRLHASGESLGRSKKFLASVPAGRSANASALFYEDQAAMMAFRTRLFAPAMVATDEQPGKKCAPAVAWAYADETAIRETSTSTSVDAGAVMAVAAIAIPNILRSRTAANEAAAIGKMRTLIRSEFAYASKYPARGFAPDLATLGPDPMRSGATSAEHANLIEAALGNAGCTAGAWCTVSGFRFSLTAVCSQQLCNEFVAVGTPVSNASGGRSFCSTSDGTLRFKAGAPLKSALTALECKSWPALR